MDSSQLFQSGSILFLKDYLFDNGTSSDKILIVLCTNLNNTAIIYSLTTSKAKLPQKLEIHGCRQSNDTDISVYVFEAGRIVGTKHNKKDYSFDKNTFLFLHNSIVEIPISNLGSYISSGHLSKLGRLFATELKALIECINNSPFVKRRIKSNLLNYLTASDLDY